MTAGWHRDYEPFELAENMEEDLGLFEAATHARRFDVQPPVVHTVLAAAAADPVAAVFAEALARRLRATVVEDLAAGTAAAVMAAAARVTAGAVVVPAAAGPELLGELLAGLEDGAGPAVAIVAGEPEPTTLDALLLPLFSDEPAARRSVSWACTLAAAAGANGLVHAVELSTPATRREARELAGGRAGGEEVQEATVGRAVAGHLGGLVAALQRHGLAGGYPVEVGFRPGWPRREILAALDSLARPATVILGRDGLPAVRRQGLAARLALELAAAGAGAVFVV
jgi:hypothetical protein